MMKIKVKVCGSEKDGRDEERDLKKYEKRII